ncbi:hypothetical protein B0O99DRAFT_619851 [Bisporella sp. PMI_857]|nr:hypothetical protein B0O99DRAFT_619851 [Bisporella sp. PMI_857]
MLIVWQTGMLWPPYCCRSLVVSLLRPCVGAGDATTLAVVGNVNPERRQDGTFVLAGGKANNWMWEGAYCVCYTQYRVKRVHTVEQS